MCAIVTITNRLEEGQISARYDADSIIGTPLIEMLVDDRYFDAASFSIAIYLNLSPSL